MASKSVIYNPRVNEQAVGEEPKRRGILSAILQNLPDILASGAEGYAQGAGNSNIAEAAAARGFSGGYRRGQELEKENKIRAALESFKASPDYEALSDEDKTRFDIAPTEFFARPKPAVMRTMKLRLSEINPSVPPELDREIEVSEEKASALMERAAAARDRRDLAKQAAEERRALAEERAQAKKEKELQDRVQKFAGTIENLGIPEAVTQFSALSKAIPKDMKDIPGVGRAESYVPDWMAGDKATEIRQLVQGLQNVKIKDRSGAAVTPPEFVRLEKEFGAGKFKSEAQFRQGLMTALNSYREKLRNAYAGYEPEVRSRYSENQGIDDYLQTMQGFDFSAPQATDTESAPIVIKSDADYNALPPGSQYVGPDGKTRRKR